MRTHTYTLLAVSFTSCDTKLTLQTVQDSVWKMLELFRFPLLDYFYGNFTIKEGETNRSPINECILNSLSTYCISLFSSSFDPSHYCSFPQLAPSPLFSNVRVERTHIMLENKTQNLGRYNFQIQISTGQRLCVGQMLYKAILATESESICYAQPIKNRYVIHCSPQSQKCKMKWSTNTLQQWFPNFFVVRPP